MRPRIVVYGTILLLLVVGWSWGVGGRSELIAEVLRDRNALYRTAGDGRIENVYTLKLINKTDRSQSYRVEVESGAGIALAGGPKVVQAEAQQVLSLPLVVTAPANTRGRQALSFRIHSSDGTSSETVDSSFFGPLQ